MYNGLRPANRRPRCEPRSRWPRQSRCAKPLTLFAGQPGARFDLAVNFVEGRGHLPVCEASPVARDEGVVERPGGLVEIVDAMAFELGDEPILEGATRASSPSPGLGAVGEEESDGQLSQRNRSQLVLRVC